ncbi:hypothetical protein PS623_03267 [Pseudomonas fluorescens]|jgi:hypothetical protein|uniref:sigma factor-like helix-turn-helix DNA-binding protein n=1 Tax=Pseudomonas TaxID=286 RepID=UPI00123FB289|nr:MULTISPECIES: sigma factor-like helix-turn-helix DNA-binding protein [Pseudomonas]MBA1195929.1 DUF4880 domain-containing protein [Pseudomonas plecoglossicida]VVN00628.1 hypothetical protein PS623_03267 [Pseudomonas fluorescens]
MTRLLPLEQHLHSHTDEDALLHRLRRLPRRVQQVFLLSRLEQLPFAAIAERLDLSVHAVERHMHQALQGTQARSDSFASAAGHWYVRLQNPQVSASERIDFRRWLDAADEHLQAFHQTELHWRRLLAPARQLGQDGWYRHGQAALSLGGCSIAAGLGLAALLAMAYWA